MAQARLRRFVDPAAEKAFRSHGEATPALKNALRAGALGCVAAALVYTAHDLLPRAVAALTGDGCVARARCGVRALLRRAHGAQKRRKGS